jgi:hypothetical protein
MGEDLGVRIGVAVQNILERLPVRPGSGVACQIDLFLERFQINSNVLMEAALTAVLQHQLLEHWCHPGLVALLCEKKPGANGAPL